MIDIDPKLLKIIALAKDGIGGEKETAILLVKKICKREDLSFDDVMNSVDYREYELKANFKTELESEIVAQTIFRFAVTETHAGIRWNKHYKTFYYTTTPAKHIETVNAVPIYLGAFRKEFKKVQQVLAEAFVRKHRLFKQFQTKEVDEKPAPEVTVESMRNAQKVLSLMEGMDEVTVHKQLQKG